MAEDLVRRPENQVFLLSILDRRVRQKGVRSVASISDILKLKPVPEVCNDIEKLLLEVNFAKEPFSVVLLYREGLTVFGWNIFKLVSCLELVGGLDSDQAYDLASPSR